MKLNIKKGTTSKTVQIFVLDSSSSVGAGLTGLVFNTASLTAYYLRDGDPSPTVITLADAAVGTWTSSGFKEVSAANMPGVYELGLPDALLASGVDQVIIMLKGATNMAPVLIEIQLVDNTEKDTYDIVNHATYGNAKLVRSTTPDNTLDVESGGTAGIDFDNTNGTHPETDANLTKIGGVAQSMTDLKDFADDGYDPATNKVQGVVLVDACIINADQRGTDNALLAASAPANFSSLSISAEGLVDILQTAADKVWASAARTLTSFGTLVADIWSAVTRTLTSGGGLTTQETRDAMKLTPTGGSPATGSVDKHLDDIQAITDNHPADLESEINFLKGALGFNAVFDDFTYDGNGKATGGTLYFYNSRANTLANGKSAATGLIFKQAMAAVITAGNTVKLTRTDEVVS
jgi:hypothetical protein